MSQSLTLLTDSEASTLAFCERRIAAGLESFRDACFALQQVRDGRLYRASHATFEDYCRVRWGWSRQRGYQLIEAAEVLASLPIECQPVVDTERAARELAKVEPEQREAVVKQAAAAGPVTAKAIKEAARAREPEPAEPVRQLEPDPETRAFKLSLKAKAVADEFKDYLAAINPTRAEMVQAACAFRKLANELDRAANEMHKDESL